jgi:hypothetical protein
MTDNEEDWASILEQDEDVDWAAILAAGDDPPKRRSVKKSLFDERILANWIRLQHSSDRDCECPNHEAVTDRERNKGMTAIVPDKDMAICRICFLEHADG